MYSYDPETSGIADCVEPRFDLTKPTLNVVDVPWPLFEDLVVPLTALPALM